VNEDVRVKMRRVPIVLVAVATIVLAACGSSGSTAKTKATGPTSTTAPPGPTAAPTTTAAAAPVVETATNATLGKLLVDTQGRTLYTLTNGGTPVACTGQCLTFWPPLLLPSGTTTASGSAGVTGLGTVAAAGGTQVTEKGAPLYRFSGDTAAGAANGEGIASFGGTWHVVTVSGTPGASTPNTTAASAPTTMGGYGY
jgi:predicted lipoprotein with Yx(FWY)xxD motif